MMKEANKIYTTEQIKYVARYFSEYITNFIKGIEHDDFEYQLIAENVKLEGELGCKSVNLTEKEFGFIFGCINSERMDLVQRA